MLFFQFIVILRYGLFYFIVGGRIPAPPGTIIANDSLFLDKELISIENYEEFLQFGTRYKGYSFDSLACLPDSSILYLGVPYLKSKKYLKTYPVLNLSDYQINEYSRWRSYAVNYMKNVPEHRTCNLSFWESLDRGDPRHRFKVEYSLADSLTTNQYHFPRQFRVAEKYRIESEEIKASTLKYFGREDVYGFRCKAKYIPVD